MNVCAIVLSSSYYALHANALQIIAFARQISAPLSIESGLESRLPAPLSPGGRTCAKSYTVIMGSIESVSAAPSACSSVSFTLNGFPVSVADASPGVSLNQWLRSQPGLTGTKRMCGEGGCGACVVAASLSHHGDGERSVAINSVRIINSNPKPECNVRYQY